MIIGVHLEQSQLTIIDWCARYTLMAADTSSATIMPLFSWYQARYEQLSDIFSPLATSLLAPALSNSKKIDGY